jgi:prolipoprotein diacylglyceryltransferase
LQHQPAASLPVYPVQLYESAACILLALLIWGWRAADDRGITGQKFLAVGLGYAAIRFCTEFLRADNPAIGGGLTFSQWIAVVIAILAAATWILRVRHQDRWHVRRAPRYNAASSGEADA